MLEYYKDCDAVLRKHLDYQDKIDSSPIEPRNKPIFITVCEDVLGRYDIEYFRAIHHELKSNGLIQINVNKPDLDEPFWRNVVTQKGFHFCQTTSFVKKYEAEKQLKTRNELFIVLGVIAAVVSAIYSGLTYYKPDTDKKTVTQNSSEQSQKYIHKLKPLPKNQLKDSITHRKIIHQ